MTILAEASQILSSGELPTFSPERTNDIEQKHRRIAEFLREKRYSALLLQRPSNLTWFTSGADFPGHSSSEPALSLFVMPEARVVLSSNADSAQLFEGPLIGHGFQSKERPWYEPHPVLVEDVCRGRVVASDTGVGKTIDVSPQLRDFRLPLNALECERLRELGLHVAHAVEATARTFEHGESEAVIAGQLSHRLLKHCVMPVRLQVCGDGISQRFRHWNMTADPVERFCTLTAIGRRGGLCAAASRTVCFGEPPDELQFCFQLALMTQATGMFFSQSGLTIAETWKRVARIYEKFARPEEWELADQAEVIGYEPCEVHVTPQSEFVLQPGMALFWHPSVGPALVGDTMLIGPNGLEMLTPMEQWPMAKVDVRGSTILRPDILHRVT